MDIGWKRLYDEKKQLSACQPADSRVFHHRSEWKGIGLHLRQPAETIAGPPGPNENVLRLPAFWQPQWTWFIEAIRLRTASKDEKGKGGCAKAVLCMIKSYAWLHIQMGSYS